MELDGRSETMPESMDIGAVATALKRQLCLIEDVDVGDEGNPLFCTEYVKDIYRYLSELEVSVCVGELCRGVVVCV